MNSRSLSTFVAATFLVLGVIFMGLRYQAIRKERIAVESSRWELSYVVQFKATGLAGQEEAQVRLALPSDTSYITVHENTPTTPSPNLKRRMIGPLPGTGNEYLQLTTGQASEEPYIATANFFLTMSPRGQGGGQSTYVDLSPDAEQMFLQEEEGVIPTSLPDVRQMAQLALNDGETKLQQIQWIFERCAEIDSTSDAASDAVRDAVATRIGTPLARARTMVTLCRVLNMPARLVTGFIVRQGADVQPHVWVEVYQRQEWLPYDPTNGYSLTLPPNYLPVRRGGDQIYSPPQNVSDLTAKFSIKREKMDQAVLRREIKHPMQIFDLTRLPVPMHKVMALLLLLPFGALITALMRNVVGLQTFGTFAPALLAMSFIYSQWQTGLAILIIVATVGLLGRFWLERLRLLMVPRLSIILTLVILCVVFSVSTFDFMGLTPSAQAVLLPMVILTILIERVHVTIEEDGLMFALKLTAGTLVVAALCYVMLGWDEIGAWVLRYPEVHFFTIAAFIVLGRYAGYRLTELWRFRDLIETGELPR
jgi:transglutaminase-like putative cysteine protease